MPDDAAGRGTPFGFGVGRLKIVLWLKAHPEIDEPGFAGQVRLLCHHGSVKATIEPPLQEIRVDDLQPPY